MPDPGKPSRFVEPDSLLAERNFARLENNPENYIAQSCRQQRADARGYSRVRVHQSRNENARDNSRDGAANCYSIGNNKMLEIDKCRDDHERNENPIGNCDLRRECLPERKKQKRGDQFDREIAECDSGSAICATTAEPQPAEQWQILAPRDRGLTIWTK